MDAKTTRDEFGNITQHFDNMEITYYQSDKVCTLFVVVMRNSIKNCVISLERNMVRLLD